MFREGSRHGQTDVVQARGLSMVKRCRVKKGRRTDGGKSAKVGPGPTEVGGITYEGVGYKVARPGKGSETTNRVG